ncbi:MAG: N-acetylneuraminate synthase family protein [bacterium]
MKNPFIIAEIAQGFEGSKKLVELYLKAFVYSGADAIKFQIFYADELALPDYAYYSLFKSLELSFDIWKNAVKEVHKKGREFYSDIYGIDSLKKLELCGLDGYKIHSTDINNIYLLKYVAKTRKKVFLSTGGSDLKEIETALSIFDKCDVTLMVGFQAEPTEISENNLNRINILKNLFKKPVGFQDHTAGDSILQAYPSFVAMGLGACCIEKHLTLSRAARVEDYVSALIPEEFQQWVYAVKEVYKSLGKKEWKLTRRENEYKAKVKRAVCSIKDIKKGDIITQNSVTLKRANDKDAIFSLSNVIGKKTLRHISRNSSIKTNDLK